MPRNQLRYWRLQRKLSISDMAFTSNVSPRLITKIEADPNGYVLKSDTMAKIANGLGVPAFMLFFPDDLAMLNKMMTAMLVRQAEVFSTDSLVNMFSTAPRPRQSADADDQLPHSPVSGRR